MHIDAVTLQLHEPSSIAVNRPQPPPLPVVTTQPQGMKHEMFIKNELELY